MNRDLTNQFDELAEEFSRQIRLGMSPDPEAFVLAHPEHAPRIRELFPLLQMMEHQAADSAIDDSELMRQELDALQSVPTQRKLGDYRIIRELGRGGMGVVYQAEQESIGRHVALKLLPNLAQFDERRKQRFQQEARASGMLHHTNIVPLFGMGISDNVSYLVMQYIDGNSLDVVINELRQIQFPNEQASNHGEMDTNVSGETPISHGTLALLRNNLADDRSLNGDGHVDPPIIKPKNLGLNALECSSITSSHNSTRSAFSTSSQNVTRGSSFYRNVAKVGLQVSDALAYAHSKKVLHRDIKPANLLIDTTGNVWVTDFGLAKLSGEGSLTHTGETVGTLRYLPPEQFDGKSDPRSDIYSLGLTLYELLTLKPAYVGADFAQLLQNVTDSEPTAIRKLDPRVPRDLATIISKAIAKSPESRYQTAHEFHADLQRFLDGNPIKARRASEMDRWAKAIRRRPMVSLLTAALFVALLIGGTLVTWKWREATAALALARMESNQREKINKFLLYDFLNYANPRHEPDPEIKLRTVLDRAARLIDERFADYPESAASLHLHIGQIYLELTQAGDARLHFEAAHRLRVDTLGEQHPDTNDCRRLIGLAEHGLGNYEQSLWHLDHAIAFCGLHFGPDSVEQFQVRFDRAAVLISLARFEEAQQEVGRYLQLAKIDERLDLLGAQIRLAAIKFDRGEFEAARLEFQVLADHLQLSIGDLGEANDLTEQQVRELHDLNSVHGFLGLIALEQGHPEQGLAYQEECLIRAQRLLGDEHATTIAAAQRVAGTLNNLERGANARELLTKYVRLSELHLGFVHPQTLSIKAALASSHAVVGDFEVANQLLHEVYQQTTEVLGLKHRDTITAAYNLASAYYRGKQPELAVEIMEPLVPICREVLGNKHTQTINALADLGHIHRALGKFDLAEQELMEALHHSRAQMRRFHPELLQTIFNIQILLIQTKQFEKAQPLAEELVAGYIHEFGETDLQTIQAKNILAHLFKQQQNFDAALPIYEEIWQHHCSVSGPTSHDAASILMILADIDHQQKQYGRNAHRLNEFCELTAEQATTNWSRCQALYLLGRAFLKSQDVELAEARLLDAFQAIETFPGVVPDSTRNAFQRNTTNCLIELYKHSGDDQKLAEWQAALQGLSPKN